MICNLFGMRVNSWKKRKEKKICYKIKTKNLYRISWKIDYKITFFIILLKKIKAIRKWSFFFPFFGCSTAYGVPGTWITSKPHLGPRPQLQQCSIFNPRCWLGFKPESQQSKDTADPVGPQWELLKGKFQVYY